MNPTLGPRSRTYPKLTLRPLDTKLQCVTHGEQTPSEVGFLAQWDSPQVRLLCLG